MDWLLDKAKNLCGQGQMVRANYFMRTKDKQYWQNVAEMGYMEAHVREDREGHNSPLNYPFPGNKFNRPESFAKFRQ